MDRHRATDTTTAVAFGLLIALAFAVYAAPTAQTQASRPRSPAGSSATQLGGDVYDPVLGATDGKWVEITYGRPIRRARDVFGPDDFVEMLNDGAPVWRAGANVTTRLISEVPLQIGGTRVPAGEHTVFIELARAKWTFILSTHKALAAGSTQKEPGAIFGAYEYTPEKDLLRTPMTLQALEYSHDQLHWEFLDVTATGGKLAIFWDKQMAWVAFTVVK